MIKASRADRKWLRKENAKWPLELKEVGRREWPEVPDGFKYPERVFRSRQFMVQIFEPDNGATRLTIQRARLNSKGEWDDMITWDELQRLKAEAGFGDRVAVELFPPDDKVVNVANLRHLWILDEELPFMWGEA